MKVSELIDPDEDPNWAPPEYYPEELEVMSDEPPVVGLANLGAMYERRTGEAGEG